MRAFDRKVLAGMAVTILALATVAPFAEAGTYRHRTSNSDYYRGPVVIQRSYPSYPSGGRYYRSQSSVGPALAGFFGGLLLGAVLTNRSNQVVYRDPYCDRDFSSRQEFIDHCNRYHRSREVRIVHYSSGRQYYDDCQDRGYYGNGGYNDRTYQRDDGYYRQGDDGYSRGDNGYYRGDSRNDDQYYRNDGYDNGQDYRNQRRDRGDDEDDDR